MENTTVPQAFYHPRQLGPMPPCIRLEFGCPAPIGLIDSFLFERMTLEVQKIDSDRSSFSSIGIVLIVAACVVQRTVAEGFGRGCSMMMDRHNSVHVKSTA